ncbi:MAG: alpha/beta hydrolase [Calditrichaeota bacterium]|nr:alpha/beta hydrolase [Calditrichota bacterium]
MLSTIQNIVMLGGGIYIGLCILLVIMEPKLIFFPEKQMSQTPENIGLVYESLMLPSSNGVKIHGWFVPSENAKATIIFCHGNAGNISHRMDSIRMFNEMGLSVFIFDYQGYGKSEGKPTEKGTYQDAQAAWDYLVKDRKTNPEEIIIFGRSLGGAIAAWLAKENTAGALIVESTFTSIAAVGQRMYPIIPVKLISSIKYNTMKHLKQVRVPVLVVHSPDDELISFKYGQQLFDSANEPKHFLEIKGTHNDGFLMSGENYVDGIKGFLEIAE